MYEENSIEIPMGLFKRPPHENWYMKLPGMSVRSTGTRDLRKAKKKLEVWETAYMDERAKILSKIYFIQSGNGPIKIGYSIQIENRLPTMQSGNPCPLTLLKTVFGGQSEELAIHRKFKAIRIRGEWFEPTSELLNFIQRVTDANLEDEIDVFRHRSNRWFKMKKQELKAA